MPHTLIIGNGIAGITAARFIRKRSDDPITIISAESDHFYSRTALMYIYMGHMTYEHTKPYEDWFWSKNNIELLRAYVDGVDTANKRLSLNGKDVMHYDRLIIATGSRPNKFGWPGQDLDGVQGLYSLQDLQRMEDNTDDIRHATVVGGGLIGIEMAEMLHTRHIPTTFLVRESSYMDYLLPDLESQMVNEEIVRHHIDLRLSTELSEIVEEEGRAATVKTNTGDTIETQFVGLTAGVSPAISFLADSEIETGRGVLVDEYFETSIPDVYAIGDCAEFRDESVGHRKIEQLWYTGRKQGKALGMNLTGTRQPYDKGVFFNSAKFFTIEYQTYGDIPASPVDGVDSLVWNDPDNRRLVRINYDVSSGIVTGFNAFGVRLRHEQCEAWLTAGASVDEVIRDLKKANFDPEFEKKYAKEFGSIAAESRGGRHSSSPVTT